VVPFLKLSYRQRYLHFPYSLLDAIYRLVDVVLLEAVISRFTGGTSSFSPPPLVTIHGSNPGGYFRSYCKNHRIFCGLSLNQLMCLKLDDSVEVYNYVVLNLKVNRNRFNAPAFCAAAKVESTNSYERDNYLNSALQITSRGCSSTGSCTGAWAWECSSLVQFCFI